MPLPSVTKTFQISANNGIASTGVEEQDYRTLLRTIKNQLKGFATQPWAVKGSSDSAAAGMDNTDRWSDNTKLVPNSSGSAHSWIVLGQSGIATNFQVCLDLNTASASGGSRCLTIVVSPVAGFGGGSTTARPTAADEIVLASQANWAGGVTGGDDSFRVHLWQSTDGQCTRVAIYTANVCVGFWLFDRPSNPVSGWTNPSVSVALAGKGLIKHPSFRHLLEQANAYGRAPVGTMSLYFSCEGYGSQSLGEIIAEANEISGGWPIMPIGLVSRTTGAKGRHGQLFDVWFGSTALNEGDTYPNSTAKTFVQVGNLVLPWNGSTFQTA